MTMFLSAILTIVVFALQRNAIEAANGAAKMSTQTGFSTVILRNTEEETSKSQDTWKADRPEDISSPSLMSLVSPISAAPFNMYRTSAGDKFAPPVTKRQMPSTAATTSTSLSSGLPQNSSGTLLVTTAPSANPPSRSQGMPSTRLSSSANATSAIGMLAASRSMLGAVPSTTDFPEIPLPTTTTNALSIFSILIPWLPHNSITPVLAEIPTTISGRLITFLSPTISTIGKSMATNTSSVASNTSVASTSYVPVPLTEGNPTGTIFPRTTFVTTPTTSVSTPIQTQTTNSVSISTAVLTGSNGVYTVTPFTTTNGGGIFTTVTPQWLPPGDQPQLQSIPSSELR
ncbi:hypothetical protein EV356DRAFT_502993 [Viridothelium virens]|uniref:Uncharacterized protein n=1 Tax=Viridothelium virens TaxID=1048519 RepID=A0A6A6H7D6_VIRVR|nr:hypothetical protein EV356DRAFT_502993 [Viridothelium virens]